MYEVHSLGNGTETWTPRVAITDLRTDPVYSSYSNWSRLIVLGIVPFLALVVFNWKIFQVRAIKEETNTAAQLT